MLLEAGVEPSAAALQSLLAAQLHAQESGYGQFSYIQFIVYGE